MTTLQLHPVDYFNFHGSFRDIFRYEKDEVCKIKSDTEVACINPSDLASGLSNTTYKLTKEGNVEILQDNSHGITKGDVVSKFFILSHVRFKGDYKAAESHVLYKIMQVDVPYVRIGTDYYKTIKNTSRWAAYRTN